MAPDASARQVRHAYWEAAQRWHPDANLGSDTSRQFNDICRAYHVLRDAERRAEYDKSLRSARMPVRLDVVFVPNTGLLLCLWRQLRGRRPRRQLR
ncbi:MAG: J domain-containing protein [Dactylosporangium sp.]|nr:J domain-containing protein [Dactylosporangium sp.]